jgi:uncharacterized SAM-binding protein YcdF (DUF218 family)
VDPPLSTGQSYSDLVPLTFTLRKLLAPFLFPLSIALELLVVGVVLLLLTRYQRAGRIAVTAGTCLLLLISLDVPTTWMLEPLEYRYPVYRDSEAGAAIRAPNWIVVLGGGFTHDTRLPVTSRLSTTTLARLVEGVRLYKRFPGRRLVVSGGAWYDSEAEAVPMSEAATLLGVAPADIVREEMSRDTEDQARLVGPIVGRGEFFLVTSASHLPRAMALFRKKGLRPIAVGADYDIKGSLDVTFNAFQPKAGHIGRAEAAAYEYLGLAWARHRGAI